jgi:hypothetical protein
LRNLITSDLFSLTRIIKKMNLKEEIKALAKDITGLSDKEKKKANEGLQAELVILFIENIGNAEDEIYKFLGNLSDKKPKEIAEQPPLETINMIEQLFSEENFGDFLSLALK